MSAKLLKKDPLTKIKQTSPCYSDQCIFNNFNNDKDTKMAFYGELKKKFFIGSQNKKRILLVGGG